MDFKSNHPSNMACFCLNIVVLSEVAVYYDRPIERLVPTELYSEDKLAEINPYIRRGFIISEKISHLTFVVIVLGYQLQTIPQFLNYIRLHLLMMTNLNAGAYLGGGGGKGLTGLAEKQDGTTVIIERPPLPPAPSPKHTNICF